MYNNGFSDSDLETQLNCLMTKSTAQLLKVEAQKADFLELLWVPVVDSFFLPDRPEVLMERTKFTDQECIVGTNAQEGFYFIVYELNGSFPIEKIFDKTEFILRDSEYEMDVVSWISVQD